MSNEQIGSESEGRSRESNISGLGAEISNKASAAISTLSDAAQYATEKAKNRPLTRRGLSRTE